MNARGAPSGDSSNPVERPGGTEWGLEQPFRAFWRHVSDRRSVPLRRRIKDEEKKKERKR